MLTPLGKRLRARWVYVMVRVGEEFVVPYTDPAVAAVADSGAYPTDFAAFLARFLATLDAQGPEAWPAASYYPGGWYRDLRERGQDPDRAEITPQALANFTLEEVRVDAAGRWHMGGRPVTGRVLQHFLRHLEFDAVLGSYRVRYRLEGRNDARYLRHASPPLRVLRLTEVDGQVWVNLNDGGAEPLRPETLVLDAQERLFCAVRAQALPAQFEDAPRWALLKDAEPTPVGWRLALAGAPELRPGEDPWPAGNGWPE